MSGDVTPDKTLCMAHYELWVVAGGNPMALEFSQDKTVAGQQDSLLASAKQGTASEQASFKLATESRDRGPAMTLAFGILNTSQLATPP